MSSGNKPHPDARLSSRAPSCRHIFAYGSLIWNPGFDFVTRTKAKVNGYHRALCLYSRHYRGNPEKPGLVLGLDRGGACHGIVYEIEDDNWADVLAYVRGRELISGAYAEVVLRTGTSNSGETVEALSYAVNRQHEQYAGKLEPHEIAKFVAQGQGTAGSSLDYVENTLKALNELGIKEKRLGQIMKLARL